MKTRNAVLAAFVAFFGGYVAKTAVVEVERILSTHYVDACFSGLPGEPTDEQRTTCYGAARNHLPYRAASALDFQPALWKNTKGRCVGTKGTKAFEYFECKPWNELAL